LSQFLTRLTMHLMILICKVLLGTFLLIIPSGLLMGLILLNPIALLNAYFIEYGIWDWEGEIVFATVLTIVLIVGKIL
jgi:hypothetical protein